MLQIHQFNVSFLQLVTALNGNSEIAAALLYDTLVTYIDLVQCLKPPKPSDPPKSLTVSTHKFFKVLRSPLQVSYTDSLTKFPPAVCLVSGTTLMNRKGSHWWVEFLANHHDTNLIHWIRKLKLWDDIHGNEQNQDLVNVDEVWVTKRYAIKKNYKHCQILVIMPYKPSPPQTNSHNLWGNF
jgi:hypothetical protein